MRILRVLNCAMVSMIVFLATSASAQGAKPVQTGIFLMMADKARIGQPLGYVVARQQQGALMLGFDLGDLDPAKSYRADIYDGGSCAVKTPYGDKEWNTVLGKRVDITLGNLIKSGEPIAMLRPTELGLVRASLLLPNMNIDQLYQKTLILRDGDSIKGKLVGCGEIYPDQPIPTDPSETLKVESVYTHERR